MVGADQFGAPLHRRAGHEILKTDDPPADPVARFEDRHVGAGLRQFVGRGHSSEAGADDDDAWAGGALPGQTAARGHQHTGRGRQRTSNHFATVDRLAEAALQTRIE